MAVDSLLSRGEFFTAYTPYQAEIAQGTLQAMFEFQTLMAQLTGMDVANASLYDGSTAATEGVLMALRILRGRRVLVASSVHPEYRQVLRTYLQHQGVDIQELPFNGAGQLELGKLESEVTRRPACLPKFRSRLTLDYRQWEWPVSSECRDLPVPHRRLLRHR